MGCTSSSSVSLQSLCSSATNTTCPEQIGVLGVCGTIYTVNLGANKIGREPQTCNIVLDSNTVSKQHAVINKLNETTYFLTDLDTNNNTKLNNNILQPYIPHQLKNGDMVQFGDVFIIFRILEEESVLPMTTRGIFDTPVFDRTYTVKLNNPPSTTLTEYPVISERDGSFITISAEPKPKKQFTTSTTVAIPQNDAPSIHTLNTQLTEEEEHFDLYTSNKENDNRTHNAETQLFAIEIKNNVSIETSDKLLHSKSSSKNKRKIGDDSTDCEEENVLSVEENMDVQIDYLEENVIISPSLSPKLATSVSTSPKLSKMNVSACNEDEDGCTQKELTPEIINILSEEMINNNELDDNNGQTLDDELIPCSAEDYHIENCASPKNIIVVDDNSSENSDDDNINLSISSLPYVFGLDKHISKPKTPKQAYKGKRAYKKKQSHDKKLEPRRSKRLQSTNQKIHYTDDTPKVVNTRSRSRANIYNTSSELGGDSIDKPAENLNQNKRESETKKNEVKHVPNTISEVSSKLIGIPKPLKRFAEDGMMPSTSKRTCSISSNSSLSSSTSMNFGSAPQIVFTGFAPTVTEQCLLKLKSLGADIVSDVKLCTIVVARKVIRTCKLLCAVGLGRPIVGLDWVLASIRAGFLIDPWLHLIKDEEIEFRFQFNLRETLQGDRNYLRGYNVSSTEQVKPTADDMKLIVECSGGNWHEGSPRWICVSTWSDAHLWPELKLRGATIVCSEFILCGVLRQKIDLDIFTLE